MESGDARMAGWQGRHFDGQTAESRPVTVRLDSGGLLVDSGDRLPARWPFEQLVLMRGDRRGEPVQIERRSGPVEVVLVDSPEFFAQLRAAWPAGSRLRVSGGPPAIRVLVGMAVAGAALLFVLWRFGIPALADFAAQRVPSEWEGRWGASMLENLQRGEKTEEALVFYQPAMLVHEALVSDGATMPNEPRLVILDSEVPNAFAMPGGNVVLTTGLLRALRSPDELAAVFAHEWAHVAQRHVMRSVLRQASLQILLSLVAGDQSMLSGTLRTAGELGSLSYSRAWEREADDEAMAMLASHGTSPTALGDALASIRKAAGGSGNTLGFLSTHPAPTERLERIERAAARLPVHGSATWRDTAAWDAMKQALVTKR